ncbi:hypothetical protein [Aquimarina algiphila]|uniref:hypothetical protein n=1 Tax=Aquimarina algiphila TaxID=2047982 RepID=UPI00232A7F74|nr:hypothetical protein [Aquimarina algiphila]
MEPEFELHGDTMLLQNMKINMLSIKEEKYPNRESKIETLLYDGEKYKIHNQNIVNYEVYFSYKDSLVGVLKFENVMKWAKDYINHLYVYKDKDSIYLQYIGRETQIQDKKGFMSSPAILLNDFYRKENIVSDKEKEVLKKKFFDFYNPSTSSYKIVK